MTLPHPIVFLIDVDNTLLDNDGIQQDLKDHLERAYGRDARDRYWRILEDLFSELGYRDYLGALQRFRAEHPSDVILSDRLSIRGPTVPIRPRGTGAAKGFRTDRYLVRWRRRFSAA